MTSKSWQFIACYVRSYDGEPLYTEVMLPAPSGRFPVICIRDPYVSLPEETPEYKEQKYAMHKHRLDAGFAVVHQHCRGYGASKGKSDPFVYEKRDGLNLLDWIQKQDWYGDGIYLEGGSYTAFVHLAMLSEVPPAVKTASLNVFSSHPYDFAYLNGEYKMWIGPAWYPMMLRSEKPLVSKENCSDIEEVQRFFMSALKAYPFYKFPERLYGHDVPEFSEWFFMNGNDDDFAKRKNGVGDIRDSMKSLRIPVLLRGGWFEPFFRGMIPMWWEMPKEIRSESSFLIGPWTHSCTTKTAEKCPFFNENADIEESTAVAWFLHIRDGKPFPYSKDGKMSVYIVGEKRWEDCENLEPEGMKPLRLYPDVDAELKLTLPKRAEISYQYNPLDPPFFKGGQNVLNTLCDGAALQPADYGRADIKSFATRAFDREIKMRGPTTVHFAIRSDREDTAFLARIMGVTQTGEVWVLQEIISTLSNAAGTYDPNTEIEFELKTDPLFWTLKEGEKIRVDIASANASSYWPHSNTRGQWAVQDKPCVATNTLIIGKMYIEFPCTEGAEG